MQVIPQHELHALLAEYCPAARSALAIPYNAHELAAVIAQAALDTGYAHGYSEGQAAPWDYTAGEVAHAIAEWHSLSIARAYLARHAEGIAQAAADRDQRLKRDPLAEPWPAFLDRIIREDDPANGGPGILTPDPEPSCHKCGATTDLDTAPGRPTTCHPCALDDDLRRYTEVMHETAARTLRP